MDDPLVCVTGKVGRIFTTLELNRNWFMGMKPPALSHIGHWPNQVEFVVMSTIPPLRSSLIST